jgi:hypothetical protein
MTIVDSSKAALPDGDRDLLERYLPLYDVVITEHLAIDADTETVYRAAEELDFVTVRSPLLTASMFVRGLPARLRGHASAPPTQLRLAGDSPALPGWLLLADLPGRETAFGAIGKFWKADIEWRDVPVERFAAFEEPGWGKIACHLLVRADGPGGTMLTYECRTGTTDARARHMLARYWWLIRPFAGHIMRAALRTISVDAQPGGRPARPARL